MVRKNTIFLIVGTSLIFISLYLFTRPAIYKEWDFSSTGQIGDTIGGISAPLINLIGAYLVYISFQEQLFANRIQVQALNDEKERNSHDRIFNNYISFYESIKSHLDNLEFIVIPKPNYGHDGSLTSVNHIIYKGLNAINECVIRIEGKGNKSIGDTFEVYGMLLNFQFILKSLWELSILVESNIIFTDDKTFLSYNIRLMYSSFLKEFAERIIAFYSKDDQYIKDLIKIKDDLDQKFSNETA